MVRITRVLMPDEFRKTTDDALAAGMYSNDRRVFLPGMAWFQPWYWDPAGKTESDLGPGEARGFLSVHYWRAWALKRPPICVVCPNGEWWEIDRKSSNGTGWIVTGELPDITCTPSIVVKGYHGFLRNGEFTADLEGRGPNGHVRS